MDKASLKPLHVGLDWEESHSSVNQASGLIFNGFGLVTRRTIINLMTISSVIQRTGNRILEGGAAEGGQSHNGINGQQSAQCTKTI